MRGTGRPTQLPGRVRVYITPLGALRGLEHHLGDVLGASSTTHSHDATKMVLEAHECAESRTFFAHPPRYLGGSAGPPQEYAPPPQHTTPTAVATPPRASATAYSHDGVTKMVLDVPENAQRRRVVAHLPR